MEKSLLLILEKEIKVTDSFVEKIDQLYKH